MGSTWCRVTATQVPEGRLVAVGGGRGAAGLAAELSVEQLDLEAQLARPDIGLVILATPPRAHLEQIRAAAAAGKHVLVEKPFVPTSARAEELMKLALEKKRLLCVYQNRRWDADFLTVRKLMADGRLGRVYEFQTHFDRYRPGKPTNWKASLGMDDGGSAVFDLGVHLLDQVHVLFGMPTTAWARLVDQRQPASLSSLQDPDSFTAVLSYEDLGLLVHVRVGVLSAEARQLRFWVRGDKGSYHKSGLDPQEDQLKAGRRVTEAGFGKEADDDAGYLSVVREDDHGGKTVIEDVPCPTVTPETYLEFYALLAKALASGRDEDLPVKASEARDVLRIIEAMRKSAETRAEVTL
jgi:predicted dehydrogenase